MSDFPNTGEQVIVATRLASAFKVERVNEQSFWVAPCPDLPRGRAFRSLEEVRQTLMPR